MCWVTYTHDGPGIERVALWSPDGGGTVEIADYLRIARKRLWVLILIPLLAAGAAVAWVLTSPPEYSAAATLSTTAFVGGASNQFTGTQAATSFAASFTASATGPAVEAAASEASGVQVSDLEDGIKVTQNGASSDMTLSFSGPDKEKVIPALEAVKTATLNSMFAKQVDLAEAGVNDAQAAVIAANQRLRQVTLDYGRADPLTVYQGQLTRVAVTNLEVAQSEYQRATGQLTAAQAADILYIGAVRSVGRTQALLGTVVPVVGAAVFLSIIFVMLLEMLAHSRRKSRQPAVDAMDTPHPRATGGATEAPQGV